MKKEIADLSKIFVLKNKKLQYIKRSCDLIQIGFGDLIKIKTRKGEEHFIARYSLHIQCPFRITAKEKLILGYNDLFVSSNNITEAVDLNINSGTIFDLRLRENEYMFSNEYVVDVSINKLGDLTILLSNICLSVFVDSSTEYEQWRFFEARTNNEHIIATGNGLEIF